jgi:hypothetical protein
MTTTTFDAGNGVPVAVGVPFGVLVAVGVLVAGAGVAVAPVGVEVGVDEGSTAETVNTTLVVLPSDISAVMVMESPTWKSDETLRLLLSL